MPPPERGGLARPSWATSEAAPSRPHPRLGATESSPPAAVCESVPAARRAAEGARVLTGERGTGRVRRLASWRALRRGRGDDKGGDRKSTRLNSSH